MSDWTRVSLGTDSSGRTIRLNRRGLAMLQEAADRSSVSRYPEILQGGYMSGSGADASAGTHAGGTVLDFRTRDITSSQRRSFLYWLRRVGFAAWYRPSMSPPHIHAVAMNDRDLSAGARSQQRDYFAGRNGLANRGRDTGPSVVRQTWEQYRASAAPKPKPKEWDEQASKAEVIAAIRPVVRAEIRQQLGV